MLCALWSVKGGVGATTTAGLLAARAAARGTETLAVDLTGDLAALFGVASDDAPGIGDWLVTEAPPPDALGRLEVPVAPGLSLLPLGTAPVAAALVAGAPERLAAALASTSRTVMADVGCVAPDGAVAGGATARGVLDAASHALLVTRPCYLGLRRATRHPRRPSALVVVNEPGRALRPADVAEVLGAPVVLEIAVDLAVARAVDAGLVGQRWPRGLERVLDTTLGHLDDRAVDGRVVRR